MAQDPPVDRTPIVFRPETFARHAGAVRYVEGLIRTRAPRPSTGRFPGLAMGAWGLLASGATISAGSGLTLGSGSVTLCTRDGSTLTDTGEAVTVYNSGAAISAGGSSLAVAMEWTQAGWSTCVCGSPATPPVSCLPCAIPATELIATWTKGTGTSVPASGSGTMKYYPGGRYTGDPLGIFADPTWEYFPELPTGLGERAAWVKLTCWHGVILVGLWALTSTSSTLVCGSGPNPCWQVNRSLISDTYNCLQMDSSTCSPFSLHFKVVDAIPPCSDALAWFHDLTITD